MSDSREFKVPGSGLYCASCGTPLPTVDRAKALDGSRLRERRCINPACRKINVTVEQVMTARDARRYFSG